MKLKLFFLGRKTMANLESILKSRDTTLPAKVYIVKAMVFPVVMYRCESWIIKKAECRRIWCFEIVVLERRTLEIPLDCKEIIPINPKGNQPLILIGRTDAKAEAAILWPPDVKSQLMEKPLMLGKTEGKRRGWQRMRWLGAINDLMDMSLSKLREIVKDREAWHAAVHQVAKS